MSTDDRGPIIVDEVDYIQTFATEENPEPWGTVETFYSALAIAHDSPGKSVNAIAAEVGADGETVRGWIEGGRSPAIVRSLNVAIERGWVPLTEAAEDFPVLNRLVAWVFSGGSISIGYELRFSPDSESERERLKSLMAELGLEYELREENGYTTCIPRGKNRILARTLVSMGAPRGSKGPDIEISLPRYLSECSDRTRREFVETYLLNRAVGWKDTRAMMIAEERPISYQMELAEMIERVAGAPVTTNKNYVSIPADTARELDHIFSSQHFSTESRKSA